MIFYRLFYFLAKSLLLICKPLLNKKLQLMIMERQQDHEILRRPFEGHCIWIHAASGEIEYAKPLLRELRKLAPQSYLLVTYYSPSIKKLVLNSPEWDALIPLPFDSPSSIKKLLDRFQPKTILYARTDVWPELAYQAKQRRVHQILFSATFAKNSSRLRGLGRLITRLALNQLNEIHCVSAADALALQPLKVECPVLIKGDTRYDQVQWRLENQNLNLQITNKINPIWILGSSWPEDEAQLFEQLLPQAKQRQISLIIAPHEIARIEKLKITLQKSGLEVQLWSQIIDNHQAQWDANKVLLIDQIGYLAALYKHADLAFIGGSYKHQVHSVMEALAAFIPVLVGPFFQNNREAVSLFNKAVFLHDPKISANKYLDSLDFDIEALKKEILQHQGTSKHLANDVLKHI